MSSNFGASVPGSFLIGVAALFSLLASPSILLKPAPNIDPPPCLGVGKSSFALPSPVNVEPSLKPPRVGSLEALSESLLSGEAGFPEGLPNWNPVCLAGSPKTDAGDLGLSVDCPNSPEVLGLSGVDPNTDGVFDVSAFCPKMEVCGFSDGCPKIVVEGLGASASLVEGLSLVGSS